MESMAMTEKICREINILRRMNHPHVTRMYEVIDTPSDLFMVMEYLPGGELFDHIVTRWRLNEVEARKYFQEIISGVEHCHQHMVCHRDLKPENILLTHKFKVKVGDFGLSNFMTDGEFLHTSCGSPNYASPEVVAAKAYAGPEVDVWSCGVILYALLCGNLPFDDENVTNLFRKIKHGHFTIQGHLTSQAKDLIIRMLSVDPIRRISFRDIRRHKWFTESLLPYLSATSLRDPSLIKHESVLEEMIKLGYKVEDELTAMKERGEAPFASDNRVFPKHFTVAYHLLADNKTRNSSHSDLVKHFSKGSKVFERVYIPKAARGADPVFISFNAVGGCPSRLNSLRMWPVGTHSCGERPAEPTKWQLGIEPPLLPMVPFYEPTMLMTIFATIKALDYDWCYEGHYKIRCYRRNVYDAAALQASPSGDEAMRDAVSPPSGTGRSLLGPTAATERLVCLHSCDRETRLSAQLRQRDSSVCTAATERLVCLHSCDRETRLSAQLRQRDS
eukprot:Selendium_serpulae@DN3284_c0_g1_i5.p1